MDATDVEIRLAMEEAETLSPRAAEIIREILQAYLDGDLYDSEEWEF